MRIVGGSARGRPLRAVPGTATRPTSDRVRQSIFDLLGQRCDDLDVLDLFAGTGALSFEALSRGARSATLIESARAAQQVIERNARDLGFGEHITLVKDEVDRALPGLDQTFDLVFADPPYALRASKGLAEAIASRGLLAPGGRAVLERGKHEPRPALPSGLAVADERVYGDTVVLIIEAT
jgi:16S rRNA (guanine966-N2)-methyltransferase